MKPLSSEGDREMIIPETKIWIAKLKRCNDLVDKAGANKLKKDLFLKKTFTIGALGSGSDFSPFLQHLGIPCFNLGFGGEDPGGEYHSIYDSYDDYRRFKDPGFQYGVALAKTAGRTSLRMADAPQLPFDFKSFYRTVKCYPGE